MIHVDDLQVGDRVIIKVYGSLHEATLKKISARREYFYFQIDPLRALWLPRWKLRIKDIVR